MGRQANPDQKCPLPWVVREFRKISVTNVTIILFLCGWGGGGGVNKI